MPAPESIPSRSGLVGRRVLLGCVAGTALASLAGCGIRLEDNAPDLPLVPKRSPIPAESALLDLLANTRTLVEVTSRWRGGLGPTLGVALTTIHTAQIDVLAAILRAAGVPEPLVDPTTSPSSSPPSATTSGGPSPTSSGAVPVTASDVAALEREPLPHAVTLAGAAGVMRPTVAATLAQRYAATVLAGGRPPSLHPASAAVSPAASPTVSGTSGASASPPDLTPSPPVSVTTSGDASEWPATSANVVVEATRSATYGLQVVAAQSTGVQRTLATATLRELAALDAAQTPRLTTTPPTVLGYDLPYAVTTPAAARRLAGHVLTGLRAAYGSELPTLETVSDQPFLDLTEWLGRVEVLVRRWGGTLVPFPGMSG